MQRQVKLTKIINIFMLCEWLSSAEIINITQELTEAISKANFLSKLFVDT